MKTKKTANKKNVSLITTEKLTKMYSPTDLNGSYTGRPEDKYEIPVQDVDDL